VSYRCRDCGLQRAPIPNDFCWECAGQRRLTVGQRAYLMSVTEVHLGAFPHCDDKVLHAPDECRYCAMAEYAALHELRRRFGIAYSGRPAQGGQSSCPSEAFRPAELIERWPGNRAAPPVQSP